MWDPMEKQCIRFCILHLSKQDQRAVIQFLGAECCQPVEIYQRMQAVNGNACVFKTTVNNWTRQFRQGRQSIADLARSGRSRVATAPANTAAVEAAVRSNRHLSMKATAVNLHISVGTVHSIIQNIGYIHGLCGLCFRFFNLITLWCIG